MFGARLGHVFYAESMFSKQWDGSKMAMSDLCDWAMDEGITLIDCQMPTEHLLSLGVRIFSRERFLALLNAHLET